MSEQELLKKLGSLVSPDRLMECVKAYAAAQVAAKDAEVKRLREGIAELKSKIGSMAWDAVTFEAAHGIFFDLRKLLADSPAPIGLPIKCTCVYSFQGDLVKQCPSCKESRFLSPAPATEAPKGEAYSIGRAKEVFAARHNLTWGGIMHQFEVGSGISKTFSLEEVMEKVAEIYKNEEQE